MKLLQRMTSPDGTLILDVVEADDGTICIGFAGSSWHTHPDLLSAWLGVPEEHAVSEFVSRLTSDRQPVVVSTDGGDTIEPWVCDDFPETLRLFGEDNCVVRFWSINEG